MIDDLAAACAYNRWADARVLDACRQVAPGRYAAEVVPGWPSLHSTLVHQAGALDVWTRRFLGEKSPSRATEADLPTLGDVARLLVDAQGRLESLVAGLSPEALAAPLLYRNFRGEDVTVPLWAALRHVVNHASYHRGQVASKLRLLGVEPPLTDFVFWAIERGRDAS